MRFTMAQPEVSCHPERSCRARAPSSRRRSATGCPEPERPPGHGRLPRYTWHDAYAELREKLDALGRAARRRLPRARRREPARRPRGRGAQRRRLLRQEHDADHAPPRLLGRARDARHRRRARADAAARRRLRRVQALHRRLPDRRARRAGRARRDALPLLLDAGAGADRPRSTAPRSARRSTAATSARTSAPGTAASRSGARRGAARRTRRRTSPSWTGFAPSRTSCGAASTGSTCRATTAAWLRRNALVAAGNVGGDGERDAVSAYLEDPDEATRELAAWVLARLEERDA